MHLPEQWPSYYRRARGVEVWDLDGNKYIDYCMCYAAMVAGHADPVIAAAIAEQTRHGTLYGLPSPGATDLAEEIHRRYPVIDMLRFTQSGVEATMYAVRLARAATQKLGVLKVEGAYHGANDMLLVSCAVPQNPASRATGASKTSRRSSTPWPVIPNAKRSRH